MSDGWREALTENNPDSEFEWEKVTSEIIAINEEMNKDDDIDDSSDNVDEELMKDLPKRILVYTSLKLLKHYQDILSVQWTEHLNHVAPSGSNSLY